MGSVIEQFQSCTHVRSEFQDVQRRWTLIKMIPVTTRIETQQTAYQQSIGTLVRNQKHGAPAVILNNAT